MRIISDFHDYYDTALGFGRDPKLVYHRATREGPEVRFRLPDSFGFTSVSASRVEPGLAATVWFLVFCGTAHPLVLLTITRNRETSVHRYCWSTDDVQRGLMTGPTSSLSSRGVGDPAGFERSLGLARNTCSRSDRRTPRFSSYIGPQRHLSSSSAPSISSIAGR